MKDRINLICPECGSKLVECKCGELVSITCNFCYACGEKLNIKLDK